MSAQDGMHSTADRMRERAEKAEQECLTLEHNLADYKNRALDAERERDLLIERVERTENTARQLNEAVKANARVAERALAEVAEARAELERLREALQSTFEIFDTTCRPGMARKIGWRATAIAMGDVLRAALSEQAPASPAGDDGPPAP